MSDDIRYMARLIASMFRVSAPRRQAPRSVLIIAVLLVCAVTYGYVPAVAEGDPDAGREYSRYILRSRMLMTERALDRVERMYETEIAPVERALLEYNDDDRQLVRRIAVAIVRESRRAGVDPSLLTGMMLVENPMLDPFARSFMGATGLMQVMPLHQGKWKCGPRLDDIDSNICTGARIFASYLRDQGGDVSRALLRYNGCVTGSNTPNCHTYPRHVMKRAQLVKYSPAE